MYEYFSELLRKNGVTPYKVSKETGVSQSTLSDWKRGVSTPKNDKLQKLADYFGVSIEYLMTGKDADRNEKYYLNDETTETAQKIFEEDKILFDVYRSADKERLIEYAKRLKALRDMEKGDF